jgi:CBS-domain-containing membrane protein
MQSDHESSGVNQDRIESCSHDDKRCVGESFTMPNNSKNVLANYFGKMRATTISPPRVSPSEILWSWVGGFCGIGAVSFINFHLIEKTDMLMVIGSFGASAVHFYGVIHSDLAQPRNLVGGHLVSALTGVTAYKMLHPYLWLAAAVAVATAIAAMHATRTAHPPGGATALIAVIGSAKVHALGYLYVIVPAGLGATVMLVVALLVNNIPNTRKYPRFWY